MTDEKGANPLWVAPFDYADPASQFPQTPGRSFKLPRNRWAAAPTLPPQSVASTGSLGSFNCVRLQRSSPGLNHRITYP